MAYQKRVTFDGIAIQLMSGLQYNPKLSFAYNEYDNVKYGLWVRALNYTDISQTEFAGGLTGYTLMDWYEGTFDGFWMAYDPITKQLKNVVMKNGELTVMSFTNTDTLYQKLDEVVIARNPNYILPRIFYGTGLYTNSYVITVINSQTNSLNSFRTNDWVSFAQQNPTTMTQGQREGHVISNAQNLTIHDYTNIGNLMIDFCNA